MKVTQGEVEQAVANLNRNSRWNVREFMVGADIYGRRHQWVLAVPEEGIYRWSQEERGKLGGQTKIPHIDPPPDSSMIASLMEFHANIAV